MSNKDTELPTAEYEDEPITAEEEAAVVEARKDVVTGNIFTHEEMLGLLRAVQSHRLAVRLYTARS